MPRDLCGGAFRGGPWMSCGGAEHRPQGSPSPGMLSLFPYFMVKHKNVLLAWGAR